MRATSSPSAAAGHTLARVCKAVLSLLVLACTVAGLPLLLARVTPVIWASTHDDVTHLLDRQDTGAAFLLLLVAVGWVGWAQFAFCAVRELVAQLRGRTWRAPRGLVASQRAAALLIGSILVLLPTSSALASPAQATPVTSAAHVPGQATQASVSRLAEQASPSAAKTSLSHPVYTVRETRPAESLWRIAEHELGDGERWREIADLNEGHTMIDGTVFRANTFLQPGWQLQMPDAAGTAPGVHTQFTGEPEAVGDGSEHVVTVHAGDYLSKIAKEELGDADAWQQLFKASEGRPQPHGLPEITDPDMIYPGQHVTVPGAEADLTEPSRDTNSAEGNDSRQRETTPPSAQQPGSEQTPSGEGEQTPAPGHTTAAESSAPGAPSSRHAEQPGQEQGSPSETITTTPEPSTSAPSPASPPASGSAASSPATAPSPSLPPASAPADRSLDVRTVLGAGALLAAAITGALALRRTLQRRRRQPGETIAIASETSPAEATLAAAAEPAGAVRLDVALRTLAHHLMSDAAAILPSLRAARIGARTVEVLPEDLAQEPLTPFVSGDGSWWVLDTGAALLDEDAARDVPAPYPGLVTIGSTSAGDLLLLNLARMPALLLDGNPVHITEVCTSLALELGMSPWAHEVEVLTVGFGEDLPQLLPTARIAHMRQAAHALRDLSERLLEAHQLPETSHQPYLLLCASSLDTDTAWQFADVIDKTGTVPVTLIAPASTAAAHFPDSEILNASVSELQHLDSAGTEIIVQRLEHASYHQITTALHVSTQPAHPAQGPWQDVPDEASPVPRLDGATATDPETATPPSKASATEVSGAVFPALLAATTDPSGLRLLSPTASAPEAEKENDASPSVPVAPSPESREGTEDDAEPAVTDGAPSEVAECETHDLHAPEIRVLGPLEVTDVDNTGHGPRMAQLAALLFFRPGRSADALCYDMDPVSPWSTSTLNARMQGLRRSLGNDPTGNPYVPRRTSGEDPYRLAPGVRCDWAQFVQLVERALPLGPSGLAELENALGLVRGRPFGGKALPWAEPYLQNMVTRIIDVAHTVAAYRTPAGPHHDLSAARQAIATGLDVDDTAELLYRDWLRIEHAAGNRQGLHMAISRVQQVNRALDCSLETETSQLIHDLLNNPTPHTDHSHGSRKASQP
ncbi:LysM peptidoglycan-binding domain-containing protein [Streptomyces humi]